MIVLDANILIRAVLGTRVLDLIEKYSDRVRMFTPEIAFQDAEKYVPGLLARRGPSLEARILRRTDSSRDSILRLRSMIEIVAENALLKFTGSANQRLRRDPDDVPILAAALALDCPIWTEDQDFFGVGAATWTTANIEIYLKELAAAK